MVRGGATPWGAGGSTMGGRGNTMGGGGQHHGGEGQHHGGRGAAITNSPSKLRSGSAAVECSLGAPCLGKGSAMSCGHDH